MPVDALTPTAGAQKQGHLDTGLLVSVTWAWSVGNKA